MTNVSVVIMGCGSIGSHLAMCLAKSGIRNFVLVDQEVIAAINVPRHLGDMVDASKRSSKVEVVKTKLLNKFPDIECEAYPEDVIIYAERARSDINKADYVLVCIGQLAIERRLNFLLRKGILKIPMIFVWIEPYGVGGHVVFIHPEKGACYSCCFDDNGEFLCSIVAPGQKFFKKEAGCQSSFLPYSAIDLEVFVLMASRQITKIFTHNPLLTTAYTWVGDLNEFSKLGYKISDNYLADIPFRFKHREIMSYRDCELCKNKS
jgi:molybdopterin/thiamine biosynthesis adenylyltransferase